MKAQSKQLRNEIMHEEIRRITLRLFLWMSLVPTLYVEAQVHPEVRINRSTAKVVGEPLGEYFKQWLLCGPFPLLSAAEEDVDAIRLPGMYTDFLTSQGGETGARPTAGERVIYSEGDSVWRLHESEEEFVDLDTAVSRADRVVAYAYTEIDSAEPRICVMALGSNDGVRVWLNGEELLDNPGPRGLQLDQHLVPVALREGLNSLLLKIEERGNRWICLSAAPHLTGFPQRAPATVRGPHTRQRGTCDTRSPIRGTDRSVD